MTTATHNKSMIPPPEAQKGWFATLEMESKMKEGEPWFLVSFQWWGQWKGYTGYKETKHHYYSSIVSHRDEAPPPIDNSHLLTADGELRRDITKMRDFILVDEKQWNLLFGWYGGGPVIKRHVVNTHGTYSLSHLSVEVHLLRLYLVRSSNDKEKVRKVCSKAMTCGELMKLGLEEFGLIEEDTRMYDYHGDTRIKRLNEMETTLSSHQILHKQKIMFDEIAAIPIPPPVPPLPSPTAQKASLSCCSPPSSPSLSPSPSPPYNLQDAILSRLQDVRIQHQIVARNQKMENERKKEEKEALKAEIVELRGKNLSSLAQMDSLQQQNNTLQQQNNNLLLENERLRQQNRHLSSQNEKQEEILEKLEEAPFMDGLLSFWLSLSPFEREVISKGLQGRGWGGEGGGWREGVKGVLQVELLELMRRIRKVEERVKAMEGWMGEEDVDKESVRVAREKSLEMQCRLEEGCSRWVELYNRVSRV